MKKLSYRVFIIAVMVMSCLSTACTTRKHATMTLNKRAKIQPAYVFKDGAVLVQGEKWREKARLGWFDCLYQPPHTTNYIKVARSIQDETPIDRPLSFREMVALRQRLYTSWIANVKMRFDRTIDTKMGVVAVYLLTGDDEPDHQTVLYQSKDGSVTEVAFFKGSPSSKDWDIGSTLNGMFDAGLLPTGFRS